MRSLFSVLWLAVLSVVLAGAQVPSPWLRIRTDHFTVVTNGSERQARHTAGQLERMHAVFAKLLPSATDDIGSPISVLALRTRKDFQAVEPAVYLEKNALDLAGLFLSGDDRNYILLRLDTESDHPYETVYHEYTHYMSRHATYLPLWLNEGLAQFYQNTDIFDSEVRLGQVNGNELLFLRGQSLIPLGTLFSVDHDSPYYHREDKGSVFYGESWALTHLLFMEDFGKPESRLSNYGKLLASGQAPLPAAQIAFGNLQALQTDLNNYIQRGDYHNLRMNFRAAVDEKTLTVEPVSIPEADALRADILARDGRMAEAEALARMVLAAEPNSPTPHETMGWIKLRENDRAAARTWYGEAVALHSASYLTYFQYGALSLESGNNAGCSESLHRSVELNAHFAPALDALAYCDSLDPAQTDEALQMSLRAVGADPSNINYRLHSADIRMRRHELPNALAVLRTTEKLARTPEDRARVHAQLERVQSYSDQLDQNKALAGAEASRVTSTTVVSAVPPPPPGDPSSVEARDKHSKVYRMAVLSDTDHHYPDKATGPHHTLTGSIRAVDCFVPKGMTLHLQAAGKDLALYSNDMFAIAYTSGNFTPKDELNPCTDFHGLKAIVTYAEANDPTTAGQILSMELNQ